MNPHSTPFAFFGTPYVARDTLEHLHAHGYTPAVVITSPAAPKGRGLVLTPSETEVWAYEHSIPVLTPPSLDQEATDSILSYYCSYAIAVAYGKIIPQTLIAAFPLGILNAHYSLLPKYRGASPVESALLHGETESGVTVQQMVFKLDAGDILSQSVLPIAITDTARDIKPRLIELGSELLANTLPAFINGSIERTPQDEALATRAPKISKEEGCLSLSDDAVTNWNKYRAFVESPGTYFYALKGDERIRVKIRAASLVQGTFNIERITPEGKQEQPFSYLKDAGLTPE